MTEEIYYVIILQRVIIMKAGKVWGDTVNIFSNHNFEFHRIQVKKGGYCSKHKHLHKYNGFYIESGELVISVWKEYNLVDKTILSRRFGPQRARTLWTPKG